MASAESTGSLPLGSCLSRLVTRVQTWTQSMSLTRAPVRSPGRPGHPFAVGSTRPGFQAKREVPMPRPFVLVESVDTPEGPLELRQRGERDFMITVGKRVLMTSVIHRSELSVAELGCAPIKDR